MRRLTVKRRVLLEWLLLALLLPLLMLWLADRPGLRHLDGLLRDQLLQTTPPAPSGQVAVIVVDRESLDVLGPWPWPQDVHAQLLERLAVHRPRAVLLDLPLERLPMPLADSTPLALAMAQVPVYLVHRELTGPTGVDLRPPPPLLAAAAAGVGHVRLVPELDGVVRTLYAQEGAPGHPLPYVGLLLAGLSPAWAQEAGAAQAHDSTVPWLRTGPFGFALAGEAGRYPTHSYLQVISGQVPSELLRGRDVLVGVGADAGLGDVWQVSAAAPALRLAGVELHASALDALRAGHTVHRVEGPLRVLWIVLPLLLGLCGYLQWERHGALGGVLVALLCGGASAVLLVQHRLWLSPVAPVAGLMLGYLLWSWRRQALTFGYFRRALARLHRSPRAGDASPARLAAGMDATEHYTRALEEGMERLQALQRLFRQSLRELPVAVLLCGRDGVIRHANPAARRLLGLRQSRDLRGMRQRFVLPTILAGLRPAGLPLPEGHWTLGHEGVQYHRWGYVFKVRCVPLGLRSHGWAVVLDDLTAEHRMQAERAQWLRFLSHDLRSPQANILSHVALDERAHPSAPGRPQLAAAVRREVERTLALAEGFMDLSQAEAGDFTQDELLLEAAAGDAVDQVWAYAQSRGIQVRLQSRAEVETFVRGNGALLVRALVNLLNNAIRHSADGATVRLCLGVNGSEALLMVSDEGEGIEAAQLRRLLGQPEVQALPLAAGDQGQAARARAPVRARGIGLAVVWAVVQRHGGWIDAWSAPGAGSSFVIGLPSLAVDEANPRSETLF